MNILDRRFKYTPASKTDVAATFRRIRREQQAKAEEQKRNQAEAQRKTITLRKASA